MNALVDVAPAALKRRAISAADLELELGQSSGSATDRELLDELAATKLTLKQATDELTAAKNDMAADILASESLVGERLPKETLALTDVADAGQSSAGTLMDAIVQRDKDRAEKNKEVAAEKRAEKKRLQEAEKAATAAKLRVPRKRTVSPAVTPKKTLPSEPAPKLTPTKKPPVMTKLTPAADKKLSAAKKAAQLAGVESKVDHEGSREQYLCRKPKGGGASVGIKYRANNMQSRSEACEKAADWLQRQL